MLNDLGPSRMAPRLRRRSGRCCRLQSGGELVGPCVRERLRRSASEGRGHSLSVVPAGLNEYAALVARNRADRNHAIQRAARADRQKRTGRTRLPRIKRLVHPFDTTLRAACPCA
jgi:hypothetical protein